METSAIQRHVVAADISPENLAGNKQLSQHDKIAEASRQFESILLKQILQSAQKTVIKSSLSDDSASSGIYHDMVTNQLADSISKAGGLGMAKSFEQQLDRPAAKGPLVHDAATAAAMTGMHGDFTVEMPKNHSKIVHYGGKDSVKSTHQTKHSLTHAKHA